MCVRERGGRGNRQAEREILPSITAKHQKRVIKLASHPYPLRVNHHIPDLTLLFPPSLPQPPVPTPHPTVLTSVLTVNTHRWPVCRHARHYVKQAGARSATRPTVLNTRRVRRANRRTKGETGKVEGGIWGEGRGDTHRIKMRVGKVTVIESGGRTSVLHCY